MNIADLNGYVSSAFAGSSAGVVFEGEKRFDLVIRLSETYRKSIDNLKQLYVDLPNGSQIPLREVANINYESGPMQISRDKASRRIYVGVNVRGRDVASVVSDIQKSLDAELTLPSGYRLEYGGEYQNLQEAKARLMIVLPIAMSLIFLLLYFALKSFKQSLMIYMLFGVAVLNGLVLINRFNSLKSEGMKDINRRIIVGTKERIRPILLTATAAMLGFLPMAVSGSAGAEVQRPLATVVIGGLFTATLLTLVVIPLLYALEEGVNIKKKKIPTAITLTLVMLLMTNGSKAQTVSLQQAFQLAEQNYPTIRIAELRVNREKTMIKGVNNIGDTEFSAGVDELGRGNDATFSLLAIRQNLNLFGKKQRTRAQEQATRTARAEAALTKYDLQRAVSYDYAQAYIQKQRMKVYAMIDSIYQNFEHAAKLKYEMRETSQLEYLTAKKKAIEMKENLNQSTYDYQVAVRLLSRWLGEGIYEPSTSPEEIFAVCNDTVHPILALQKEKIKLAQTQIEVEKTKVLPNFFVEAGAQRNGNRLGYWTINVGMSIPLFRNSYRAQKQAIAMDKEIEEAYLTLSRQQLKSVQERLQTENLKWQTKLKYFQETALPTAREQQRGAASAYRLGATDYIGFIQTMGDAVQTELDYWSAYEKFINTKIDLQYPNI